MTEKDKVQPQKPVKPEPKKESIKPEKRTELEKPKPTDSAGAGKNTGTDKK